MLACARLGAVHSVVFGGFAAQELARRIEHAEVSEQNFMLMCLLQWNIALWPPCCYSHFFVLEKTVYIFGGKKKKWLKEEEPAGQVN